MNIVDLMPDQKKWRSAMQNQIEHFNQILCNAEIEKLKMLNHKHFLDTYNNIKDPNWPALATVDDWNNLPENIVNECKNIHKFYPEGYCKDSQDKNFFEPNRQSLLIRDIKSNQLQTGSCYTYGQIARVNNIIFKYKKYIQGENIVELAGGNGLIGISAMQHGAKTLTYTDISDWNVKCFNRTIELFDLIDRVQIIKSDITNEKKLAEVISKDSVIIVNGILCLLSNAVEIIARIATNIPKTIIISEKGVQDNEQDSIEIRKVRDLTHPYSCEADPKDIEQSYDPDKDHISYRIDESHYIECLQQYGYKLLHHHRWIEDTNTNKKRFTIVLSRI